MRKLYLSLFFAASLVLLLVSCSEAITGISPDPTKIHYPTGLAVHPSGRFLYVANSNFDLAFTGGTVMVFDTTEDPKNTVVVDQNGVKAKMMTLKLLSKATVEVGSFAGQLVLNKEGTRAFLAVRQDKIAGSLRSCRSDADCQVVKGEREEECIRSFCRLKQTVIASSITELKIDVSKTDGHLMCDNKNLPKEETGGVGSEENKTGTPAPRCGDRSKVFMEDNPFPYALKLVYECRSTKKCTADKDCSCSDEAKKKGLCRKNGHCLDGFCQMREIPLVCEKTKDCRADEKCVEARLLVSHLDVGGLSSIRLLKDGWEKLSSEKRQALRTIKGFDSLPKGTTSLDVLPNDALLGPSGEVFLSSRYTNEILALPPQVAFDDKSEVESLSFLHSSQERSIAANFRGITIGRDFKNRWVRLYVATRRPAAILVYDLHRSAPHKPLSPRLVGTIPVGDGPAHLLYRHRPLGQPDLLYVVCSDDRRVDVIDTENLQVVHQIKVGEKPYFIAIYEPSSKKAQVQHKRAYVVNFLDTSISIIDLDHHRVIGMIKGINTTLSTNP